MNITILGVGNIKEKYLQEAIAEYEKRLQRYMKLQIIEVEEERLPKNFSDKDIDEVLVKEGERILSKIPSRSYVVGLVIEGKGLDSEAFAERLADINLSGYSDVTFLIGGSHGLSSEVKSRLDWKLSFSKMTFPHQLMRVILLEQIYRAMRIQHHEPYHK